MASYEIRLSKRAKRDLDSFDPNLRRRIIERLEEMRAVPFNREAVKLQARENTYRIRVGDYRILYEILPKEELILIDKIDHRSKVYDP